MDTEFLCLLELINDLGRGEAELHALLKLGDDVVIIGVEPFRHLHSRDRSVLVLDATRHGKIGRQIDAVAPPLVALWHRAHHSNGIEHMIVE